MNPLLPLPGYRAAIHRFHLSLLFLLITAFSGRGAPGDLVAGFQPILPAATTTLAVQPDGRILSGGYPISSRLERNGSADLTFNQWGETRCLLVQPDGSILVGGVASGGFLGHLLSDGSWDLAFNQTFDRAVFCMAQQDDGRILAGGAFTYIGAESRSGLARLNPDGTLDPSFNPNVEAPSLASVTTMTLQASGKVVFAGDFTKVGGVSRQYIARVNADGTLDTGFTPVTDAVVYNVLSQKDDKILMGGFFTTVNGVARHGFARLNADGTLDTSFDPHTDNSGSNFALQADGKIIGCNMFNPPDDHVVRLNPDGSRDATFQAGTSEFPLTLEIEADGSLLLAGTFSTGGGTPPPGLLRMQNDPGISALSLDAGGTLLWARSGSVPEVSSVIFEKRAAGAASWTRMGTGVREAGGWKIAGVTAPVTGALRALGRTAAGSLVQSLLPSGAATPLLTVQQAGQTLASGTGEVSFGTVYGTNEHELTFSVSNPGNGSLGPLTVSFTGAGAGDFTLVRAPLSVVAPFESTVFTVRFAPAAAGSASATLNLASNAAGSPFTVHLTGERVDRLDPTFANASSVPLTRESFSAEGMALGNIALTFAPALDSVLTVVDNTGQEPIAGRFSDLPDNAIVSAVYNGQTYRFVVSYTGGTGNDLTLVRFRAGEIDAPFDAGYIERVNAMALQTDGKILIGGHFSMFGPPSRDELARLNRDGTIDPFFNPAPGNEVRTLCVQPDGKIIVGGFFGSIAGAGRNRLARLNADGSIDPDFNPDFDGPVYCTALQVDGKILVGGQFTHVGGVSRQSFARLNAGGTLDTAFNPNPTRDFGSSIVTIVVQTDGKILVGGNFVSIAGVSRASFARLNPNGSIDAAFNPAPNNDPSIGFTSGLLLQPDGKIIVSGGFTIISGAQRRWLARLNADGSIDAGFNANVQEAPYPMVLQTDGRILIGGGFTSAGGLTRNYIARLGPSGALDADFDTHLSTGVSRRINAIAVQSDGRILAAGEINTMVNNSNYRYGVVRLLNDRADSLLSLEGATVRWQRGGASQEASGVTVSVRGNDASAWSLAGAAHRVAGGWEFNGLSLPPAGGAIQAVATISDGNAGSGLLSEFLSFGPAKPGLNVQQPPGNIVPAGTGSVSFGTVYGANPQILTFAIENAGNTFLTPLTATFSGDHPEDYSFAVAPATSLPPFERALFPIRCVSQAAGMRSATLRIANPVPGLNPLVIGLSSERRNDLSPVFASASTVPLIMDGFIAQGMTFGTLTLNFAPPPGTILTVVNTPSAFSSINGRFSDLPHGGLVKATFGGTQYPFIASYRGGIGNDLTLTLFGAGILDPAFAPNPNSNVTSLALQPDGRILVGGYFGGLAGAPRNRFARLTAEGNNDPNFNPNAGFDSTVHCIAVQPDGKILAGGDFSTLFGISRSRIARLGPNGLVDPFNPLANGSVRCLLVEPDGSILIGGAFTAVAGVPRPGCAKLNADGTVQASFNQIVTGTVLCMARDPDGKILLGGSFTSVAGTARPFLARLAPDGSLDTGFTPLVNASVSCIAVQKDRRILIGGSFTSVGGETRNHFARLESSGALDPAFNPNVGGGSVYCMGLQTDGKILIGGDFTSVSNAARSRLARLNPDGSLDSAFASGVASTVQVIALQANGAVLIGGSFGPPSPPNSINLARLGNDEATSLLEVTAPGTLRWLRSGSCPEVENAAFEVVASDGTITLLGSGQRIASGWELTGVALPTTGTLRVRGRASGSLMESTLPIVSLSPREQWRQLYFGSPLNTGTGADDADPDKDGITNLVEYALGLNPTLAGSSGLPQWTRTAQGLETSFPRPAGVPGVNVIAEWSTSLDSGWQPVPDTGGADMHHFLVVQPDAPRIFVRISVTLQ